MIENVVPAKKKSHMSAGSSLSTALDIKISNHVQVFTDTVGLEQPSDFYQFRLQGRSKLDLFVNNFSQDIDVQLIRDSNANGAVDSGEMIAYSTRDGLNGESIYADLDVGTYYIKVYAYNNASSNYNLSLWATPYISDASVGTKSLPSPQSPTSTSWVKGTLGADQLAYSGGSQKTFFSGNGNADFGKGGRDVLNFKSANIFSTQVTFNWANTAGGGVVDNPGNGYRLFDAITLGDGKQILFEGIEQIEFADTVYDLSNYIVPGAGTTAVVTTNDEKFNQQWNLHMAGVHHAWRFSTGSAGVFVGVADSGLGTNSSGSIHPDLRLPVLDNNNFQDESGDQSHGTSIMSTIAAKANNGLGIAGINWHSDSMMIDVLGSNTNDYSLADAVQTFINQANLKAQKLIVNLSLSGGVSSAFEGLIANNPNNALFIIAAGNNNTSTISNPGSFAERYSNVISVGASTGREGWNGSAKVAKNLGERADNGSYWGSNYMAPEKVQAGQQALTLMAPTDFVTDSATRNANGSFDFGTNDYFNGTSASTAVVTGIASLLWSANLNLTAAQIKTILSETTYDLGDAGYDRFYGHGFVNADAAVRRALAMARGYA